MPLYPATTFERDADGQFSRYFFYGRYDNPNRHALEQCLTDLEGGSEAVTFASGMAASLAVFQALSPGDHVVLHRDLYFGVRELVTESLRPLGTAALVRGYAKHRGNRALPAGLRPGFCGWRRRRIL